MDTVEGRGVTLQLADQGTAVDGIAGVGVTTDIAEQGTASDGISEITSTIEIVDHGVALETVVAGVFFAVQVADQGAALDERAVGVLVTVHETAHGQILVQRQSPREPIAGFTWQTSARRPHVGLAARRQQGILQHRMQTFTLTGGQAP